MADFPPGCFGKFKFWDKTKDVNLVFTQRKGILVFDVLAMPMSLLMWSYLFLCVRACVRSWVCVRVRVCKNEEKINKIEYAILFTDVDNVWIRIFFTFRVSICRFYFNQFIFSLLCEEPCYSIFSNIAFLSWAPL